MPIRMMGALALLLTAAGCASAGAGREVGQGGAPQAAQAPGPEHTQADVDFMHGMMMHHAQALEMTSLVGDRAQSDQVKLIAQRIDVSQRDEMARIARWLARRGEPPMAASGDHAAHMTAHGQAMHPGMLTPEELSNLAAASGAQFDRLFLEYMIKHHQGAIAMVTTLFATEGAGQESETYQFATEVDADQRAEISRMETILRTLR